MQSQPVPVLQHMTYHQTTTTTTPQPGAGGSPSQSTAPTTTTTMLVDSHNINNTNTSNTSAPTAHVLASTPSSAMAYLQQAPGSVPNGVTLIPQQMRMTQVVQQQQQQQQQPGPYTTYLQLPQQTTTNPAPSPSNGVTSVALPPVQPTMPQHYYSTTATTAMPVNTMHQQPAPVPYSQGPSQQNPHIVPLYGKRPPPSDDLASAPPTKKQNTAMDDADIDPLHRKPPPNYASMSAEEKRRFERNVREQQRSFKISQQIKELKNVLHESNIPFKPNKFSILLSVVEYIKQLQTRAIMIDAEHRKLIDTIRQTNEMVNSGQTPPQDHHDKKTLGTNLGNESGMLFVQGIDYKAIFDQCDAGLSVAALDGRILDFNNEFASASGFSHEELTKQSVFNLMQNHEDVFKAMGQMLSNSDKPPVTQGPPESQMYWSGTVSQKDRNLHMNITLTQSSDGRPKFFNCALTATS